MLAFACACGVRYEFSEKDAGGEFRCRKCGQKNMIPPPPGASADIKAGRTLEVHAVAPPDDSTRPVPKESADKSGPGVTRPLDSNRSPLTSFLAPPHGPDEIGRLGPYRILKILGAGGMGVVYAAEDPKLQRVVALKVMLPTLAASVPARQRFLREARAIAALEHDHIVAIYQVNEDRNIPYLAMQLLQGETLADRIARVGRLDVAEVLRIGREIAAGLAAAHEHGIIHRDIKPANIWLESRLSAAEDGAAPRTTGGRVKILDFGLARDLDAASNITEEGAIAGTPAYMSPEQLNGNAPDFRSDLYSLGCLLYEMTVGRTPFSGPTVIAIVKAVLLEEPQVLADVAPNVPLMLSEIILRLLAKNPDQRPKSGRTVATALKAIGDATAVTVTRDAPPPVPGRKEKRTTHAAPDTEIVAPSSQRAEAAAGPTSRSWRRWLVVAMSGVLLLFFGGGALVAMLLVGVGAFEKKPPVAAAKNTPPQTDDAEALKKAEAIRAGFSQAIALHGQGKMNEAVAAFREVIRLDPGSSLAHDWTAYVLVNVGDAAAALPFAQKAVELDPNDAQPRWNLGRAQMGVGDLDGAIASYKTALTLNAQHSGARSGLEQTERVEAARNKFAAFKDGAYTPASTTERIGMIEWCALKKLHRTATGLYAAAFTADPKLAASFASQHRYNAARCAALAAAGQGEDTASLDDAAKAALRRQALDWLTADLAAGRNLLDSGSPQARELVTRTLGIWQADPALASVRAAAALAKLPAHEQKAFTKLWADVAATTGNAI